MEYKLLEIQDINQMKEIFDDDHMPYNQEYIKQFLNKKDAYGFVAKSQDKVVGFAYGYNLIRPDGKNMFYLHSIGILPAYQNTGYGTGLFAYIKDFSENLGCCKMFVITDKGNPTACHVYEKLGGKNNYEDEIVYVYEYETKPVGDTP